MEFPEIGEHCSEPTCNKLDFLPIKCDACDKIFCCDHMNYDKHNCPSAHKKNVQVPVCPLCGLPVLTPRNQKPDITVSEHIDNDCKADPAKVKKKIKSNKCSAPGCKKKEMIPIICSLCNQNFCLVHRFPDVHFCRIQSADPNRHQNNTSHLKDYGLLSEDEALAIALSESMKDADRYYERHQRNKRTLNSVSPQRCQVS